MEQISTRTDSTAKSAAVENKATIPSADQELIDSGEKPPPPIGMTEAVLDHLHTVSAAAMSPPGIKLVNNDIVPSPPVAMADAATMDGDAIAKYRAGGAKTRGMERIHDEVEPLPPHTMAPGEVDSSLKKWPYRIILQLGVFPPNSNQAHAAHSTQFGGGLRMR